MAKVVSAASWVAGINRGAAGEQSHGLCRAAIVPQGTEHWVRVVSITRAIEIAGPIAAQVVAFRGHRDGVGAGAAVSARRAVRNNAVLECGRTVVKNAATAGIGAISTESAVVNRHRAAQIDDTAPESIAAGTHSAISAKRVVIYGQRALIEDTAALGNADSTALHSGGIPAEGTVADRHRARVVDAATPCYE